KLVILSLLLSLVLANKSSDGFTSYFVPRNGVASHIVGGILKPFDAILSNNDRSDGKPNIIEGTYEEVVKEPLLTVADSIDSQLKAIAPGTQWCGAGDRARNSGQLGVFKNTDNCCRHHDNCPDNIPAKESKYGLNNTGSFTRSHCDCDDAFYDCLKDANSVISLKLGTLYFNVLRPQCFKKEYPVTGCEEKTGLILKRCDKYKTDTSRPQEWQWFD
ncbi:hypothetical protein L9F63_011012, partial [Diploptera punctata]